MENITDPNQESVEVEVKKLSQKEAVKQFILDAIAAKGVVREEGAPLKVLVTKDIRVTVKDRLFAGFRDGSITIASQKDDKALRKYCSGLISNWLSKDKEFN